MLKQEATPNQISVQRPLLLPGEEGERLQPQARPGKHGERHPTLVVPEMVSVSSAVVARRTSEQGEARRVTVRSDGRHVQGMRFSPTFSQPSKNRGNSPGSTPQALADIVADKVASRMEERMQLMSMRWEALLSAHLDQLQRPPAATGKHLHLPEEGHQPRHHSEAAPTADQMPSRLLKRVSFDVESKTSEIFNTTTFNSEFDVHSLTSSVAVQSSSVGQELRVESSENTEAPGAAARLRRGTIQVPDLFSTEPDHPWTRAERIVESRWFDLLSLTMIILNTMWIVIATNIAADVHNFAKPASPFSEAMDVLFISYYLVEILLKFMAHGRGFFTHEDGYWNVFDLFCVFVALLDIWGVLNLLFLRSIRIFRVARVLRIFRILRFLSDLRVMMLCVVNSMATFVWSILFIAFIVLVASLTCVQLVTQVRQAEAPDPNNPAEVAKFENAAAWFGSVQSGMTILFACGTGGIGWVDVFHIMQMCGAFGTLIFLFFIVFFMFAAFNIVTSIFLEKAMKWGRPDEEEIIKERREEEDLIREKLRTVIDKLDSDHNDTISLEELQLALAGDSWFREYFELHGLKIQDVPLFFETITNIVHESECLHLDSFVVGCMMLKGSASSLDIQALRVQVQALAEEMRKVQDCLAVSKSYTSKIPSTTARLREY